MLDSKIAEIEAIQDSHDLHSTVEVSFLSSEQECASHEPVYQLLDKASTLKNEIVQQTSSFQTPPSSSYEDSILMLEESLEASLRSVRELKMKISSSKSTRKLENKVESLTKPKRLFEDCAIQPLHPKKKIEHEDPDMNVVSHGSEDSPCDSEATPNCDSNFASLFSFNLDACSASSPARRKLGMSHKESPFILNPKGIN